MALNDKIQIGPEIVAVTNGALVANDAFSAASAVVDNSATLYPYARFVLVPNFAIAPAAGSVVVMYMQHIEVDGVNSAPVPSATYQHDFIYSFKLDSVPGAQYLESPLFEIPDKFALVFQNNATGQDLPAGWAATVKLRGFGS